VCSSSRGAYALYSLTIHLVGSVVNQDIYLAELGDGLLGKSLALSLLAYVSGHLHGLLTSSLNDLRRLLGVWLLFC
jgi:hypothetical protein